MTARGLSDGGEQVRRFSTYRVVEHLALIGLFVVLALTGLPQKFHSLGVFQSLIFILGGIDNVRLAHHVAGVLFTVLAVQHIVINGIGIVFLRWEPSMLITLKDGHDALQNMRYYVGLDDEPARCGRFTYKEKCIYWLVLIGGVQMMITGYFLWFPVAVTKYLPGQFIPASKIIHTSEAMFIFLLVATWHIYDSVLSPDVFPLNKSIFSGHMGRTQMEKLHPLELERLAETEDPSVQGRPLGSYPLERSGAVRDPE